MPASEKKVLNFWHVIFSQLEFPWFSSKNFVFKLHFEITQSRSQPKVTKIQMKS